MNTLLALIFLAMQDKPEIKPIDPDELFDRQPRVPRVSQSEPGLGIEPRISLWWPNLNGLFEVTEGDPFGAMIDGTLVSLDDDLHIHDHDPLGYYELGFIEIEEESGGTGSRNALDLSFWTHTWTGATILDSKEVFNGLTFNPGDRVKTRFHVWSLGLDVGVESSDDGIWATSVAVGARLIYVGATMSGPGGREWSPNLLPYIGVEVRTEWKPSEYAFAAFTGGMYFSLGATDGGFWSLFGNSWAAIAMEGVASVGVEVLHVRAEIGVRLAANAFEMEREGDVSLENNDFSYLLFGPFAQLSISW